MTETSHEFDPYLEWLGIEPHERPADHYRLLGVAPGEPNLAAIRMAADERLALVESMRNGPRAADAQRIMDELSAARACLLDDVAKTGYDQWLAAGGWRAGPPPSGALLPPAAVSPDAPAGAAHVRATARSGPVSSGRLFRLLAFSAVFVATVVVCIGVGMLLVPAPGENGNGNAQGPRPPADPATAGTGDEPRESIVIAQEGSGVINLPVSVATQHGGDFQYELDENRTVLAGWTGEDQWISWRFRVTRTGLFQIEVTYSIAADAVGGKYTLAIDDDQKDCLVNPEAARGVVTDQHRLEVTEAGEHRLVMRAAEKPGRQLLKLRSVRLTPVAAGDPAGQTRPD